MPYIGNDHYLGNSTSNFKVLDDIKSYIATFDGSSSSIVNITNDSIEIPSHRFVNGQRVIYANGSSTTTITVTVGTDTVGGQSTGVFYFDGVEKPASYALKRGNTYIFDQSHSTNETYGGANHPLMVSTGSDGEHNGHGHYMTGITYKLDGATVNMMGYTSGFNAATERSMEWTVPASAPAALYYWCHHHTGQGNSYAITDDNVGGLTDTSAYYIIKDGNDRIKLAASAADVLTSTSINLSSLGNSSNHSVTAAFDGVNKKFKATFHDGTTHTNVLAATQLNISINGVLQQPYNNATEPPNGYTLVNPGNIIVFSEAPESTFTFWGNIIADAIKTFDIDDNKIDNFIGDGATVDFTLSQTVPDNSAILVTIDGLVKQPIGASNSNDYSVDGNILTFTATPSLGAKINVRHVGYAAPSGKDYGVTGFQGRTGLVTIVDSDPVVAIQSGGLGIGTVRTLNFVGAGNTFDVSGNKIDISIAGGGGGGGENAVGETGFLKNVLSIANVSVVETNTTIEPLTGDDLTYVKYQDIKVNDNIDLIIASGDFVINVYDF